MPTDLSLPTHAATETVQLRRYALRPGTEDAFAAAWAAKIPALRARYGFRIPFAYLDREYSTFLWAVAVEGDAEAFAAADARYYASPEKQSEPPRSADSPLLSVHTSFVSDALTPRS